MKNINKIKKEAGKTGFSYRKPLLVLIDIVMMIFITIVIAELAFSHGNSVSSFHAMLHGFAALLCLVVSRAIFGVYRDIWRYAGTREYLTLIIADVAGGIAYALIEIFVIRNIFKEQIIPLTSMMFLVMFSLISAMGSRMLYQVARSAINKKNEIASGRVPEKNKINIAIIGAGRKGMLLAESLNSDLSSKYNPFCFLDKDVQKIGNRIGGLPVYEESEDFVSLVSSLPIQGFVIAIEDISPDDKKALFDRYDKTGLSVLVYDYPIDAYSDGLNAKRKIRDIKIDDLLFRDEKICADTEALSCYTDKTVLVTGAGGSIGSELCRQISKLGVKKLILLDIYENSTYDIQQELFRMYGGALNMSVEIASVRDREKISTVFAKYKPQIIFHAAAHKHVPLMEDCIDEAVKNNVFGTLNVADMAELYGAEKFIMISTDKAVNPTSVMGATKRICEMIIASKADSATKYAAVRFGNVLGSNGSVIPLFTRQIENGGPVTLTDKRISRYFMTIPEAVSLVMEAGGRANKSEIYVLDMGEPLKILTLAEKMISLAGYRPYIDINIIETGLRKGEKLYEELTVNKETMTSTTNRKIFIDIPTVISRDELGEMLSLLRDALKTKDAATLKETVKKIVPNITPPTRRTKQDPRRRRKEINKSTKIS